VNLGSPGPLGLCAADGRTRLDVGAAFLSGPHATSFVSDIAPGTPVLAVHFRPGGAYPLCGTALHDLANANVDVEAVWGLDARYLQQRLLYARFSMPRHPGVAHALAAIEQNSELRIADAGRLAPRSG
jgi:hypothetical protein